MVASATIYLTDGIARLDLPGRISRFTLREDWICEGSPVEWDYRGRGPITVAGFEIVRHFDDRHRLLTVEQFDDYSVQLVQWGHVIRVTPYIDVGQELRV